MGQININKGTHIAPPDNSLGIGFNANGDLVRVNTDGSTTIYQPNTENPQNVIANKGIGLEVNLPGSANAGDVYVTTDTFKIYIAQDSVSWSFTSLTNGQFVTDILNTTELPPVYQFYNNILMPIANYVESLPNLPE